MASYIRIKCFNQKLLSGVSNLTATKCVHIKTVKNKEINKYTLRDQP